MTAWWTDVIKHATSALCLVRSPGFGWCVVVAVVDVVSCRCALALSAGLMICSLCHSQPSERCSCLQCWYFSRALDWIFTNCQQTFSVSWRRSSHSRGLRLESLACVSGLCTGVCFVFYCFSAQFPRWQLTKYTLLMSQCSD